MPSEMQDRRASRKKLALDDLAKQWWSDYLKGTGLDEQLFKVALKDVLLAIESEDRESPEKVHLVYDEIKKKHNLDLDIIRQIRSFVINDRLMQREGIATIVYNRNNEIDRYFWNSKERCCQHSVCGKYSLLHFKNKDSFERSVNYLRNKGIRFYSIVPETWNEREIGKKISADEAGVEYIVVWRTVEDYVGEESFLTEEEAKIFADKLVEDKKYEGYDLSGVYIHKLENGREVGSTSNLLEISGSK